MTPGARRAWGPSLGQVHSGEILNTQSLGFPLCKTGIVIPALGLPARSTGDHGCGWLGSHPQWGDEPRTAFIHACVLNAH